MRVNIKTNLNNNYFDLDFRQLYSNKYEHRKVEYYTKQDMSDELKLLDISASLKLKMAMGLLPG